jgi:3-hydroxyisobutyrate dehydrogenase
MKKIGFIGLGHMGFPMMSNLIKAGFSVKAFDLNPDALKSAEKMGAILTQSIQEVSTDVDAVLMSLQTGEQVSDCCLKKNGIFESINPGAIIIDMSSIDIGVSRNLHEKALEMGLAMVDAPVSGGVKGAEAATLTIMVGSSKINFDRAEKYLEKLAKLVIHAGEPGSGQAAKICNNMILGISMIAVSEAFLLAEKLGLAPEKLFEISSHASGQCWSMTSYCPYPGIMENVPSNNNYKPGFSANMMLKDLKLSQRAAEFVHAKTPLGSSATDLYEDFVSKHPEEIDFSGIITYLMD